MSLKSSESQFKRFRYQLQVNARSFSVSAFYNLFYLFTKKQPLSWSQNTYGYYMGSTHVAKAFGMLVILPFLKKMRVKDTYILGISLLSYTVSGFMLSWSKDTWLVFLGMYMKTTYLVCTTCIKIFSVLLLHRSGTKLELTLQRIFPFPEGFQVP